MSDKLFFYVWAYIIALIVSFFVMYGLLIVIIGALMFITMSLPLASPFTWVIFRVILVMSVFWATILICATNFKEWVEKCIKELKK